MARVRDTLPRHGLDPFGGRRGPRPRRLVLGHRGDHAVPPRPRHLRPSQRTLQPRLADAEGRRSRRRAGGRRRLVGGGVDGAGGTRRSSRRLRAGTGGVVVARRLARTKPAAAAGRSSRRDRGGARHRATAGTGVRGPTARLARPGSGGPSVAVVRQPVQLHGRHRWHRRRRDVGARFRCRAGDSGGRTAAGILRPRSGAGVRRPRLSQVELASGKNILGRRRQRATRLFARRAACRRWRWRAHWRWWRGCCSSSAPAPSPGRDGGRRCAFCS